MTDPARTVTGGVDTHKDTHVVGALDGLGQVLGTEAFPATGAGYQMLRIVNIGVVTASPILPTPSGPPGPCSPAKPAAFPSPPPAASRRSGSSRSLVAAP